MRKRLNITLPFLGPVASAPDSAAGVAVQTATVVKTPALLEARLRELADLAGNQDRACQAIRQSIATAAAAHAEAVAAQHDALTRRALGEADDAAVDAAIDAVLRASQALQAARAGEADADGLSAAAAGIRARMAPIESELGSMRAREAAERDAAMVAELHRRIDAFHATGAQLLRELAAALAFDEHLNSIGKPQGIGSGFARQTVVGLFENKRGSDDMNSLMTAARQQVIATFGR